MNGAPVFGVAILGQWYYFELSEILRCAQNDKFEIGLVVLCIGFFSKVF